MSAGTEPVVETRKVVKSFAGVQALRGVDFAVHPGEVHALLGQNGAGKSTLVKILNGVYQAGTFAGEIRMLGHGVSFGSTSAARAHGIGYVPQEVEVLEQLSVAENVFAGQMHLGGGPIIRPRAVAERARQIFQELGLTIDPGALVASLGSAQRHLVMIARALSFRPRVLMLDEPTASLSGAEVERLFAVLKRLKGQGVTVIFITHRLPEVLRICDRATVLRDGRVVATLDRDQFDEERFIYAMSGQKLQRLYPQHQPPSADAAPLLSVRNLCVAGRFGVNRGVSGVSFEARPGEIVGLVGLLGSGRTEILHALYGRIPFEGDIAIAGAKVGIKSPADARRLGIGLLTEDRKHDGLLFNLPVGANITIGNLTGLSKWGLIQSGKEGQATLKVMRALNVKARSTLSSVAHLSGGNQQKLLFGRALMSAPRLLMLDEPTKGVDAATRHEIYRLIVELADKGMTLIVVASELEEVMGLADRCLVVVDGRICDTFARGEASEESVLKTISAAQAQSTDLRVRT